MNIELFKPYIMKILISLRGQDSISSISKRIGLSYGWTNKWVNELIKEGILKEKWRGVVLQKENEEYKNILRFIKENLNDVKFSYFALQLFGIDYCFTKTDGVYIWTEGRYNIARYREFYPIFIKIKRQDYTVFLDYCKKLNLKVNAKKGVFYSPEISEDFKCIKKGNSCVEPLDESIEFMKKNIYNFEPALEMIKERYGKGLTIKYKETNLL